MQVPTHIFLVIPSSPLPYSNFRKEGKTGYSSRQLPSQGNRGFNTLDRSFSYGSLHPPWGLVKDITRKIPSLVRPSEYSPLLLFLVGGNESTIPPLRAVKSHLFASAIVLAQWIIQTCFYHRRAKFNWHTFLLQNCYCNAWSILHLSLVIALSRWGPSPNHIKLILRTLKQLKETTSLPPAIK